MPRAMQDCQYEDSSVKDAVGKDVGRPGNNEFARLGFATRMTEMGMFGELFNAGENSCSHASRSPRFVLRDEFLDFNQVGDGRFRPNYSHDGAGDSRLVPHERNQRDTFS